MPICVFPLSETVRGKIVCVNAFAEDIVVELKNYC